MQADQNCIVRHEARAKEFMIVARLIPSRKKPQRKRGGAIRKDEAASVITQVTIVRPEASRSRPGQVETIQPNGGRLNPVLVYLFG